jgi:hypothetical protein
MRKQELVHLHALCALARSHLESRENLPAGAFSRYDECDVSPSAIYCSKGDHRRAVRLLAAELACAVDGETAGTTGSVALDRGTDGVR